MSTCLDSNTTTSVRLPGRGLLGRGLLGRGLLGRGLLTLAVGAALSLAPGEARAEGPVSPTGKGIVGGGLLGAELGLMITGAVGAKSWWPYVLFGAVGAGGGAVGGYFVETEAGVAEPSLYMLAGGMALVIPTFVVVLNATAYDPTEDVEEGEIVEGEEEIEGKRKPLPMAVFGVDGDGPSLGIPAVQVRQAFTASELSRYGVEQRTEVHVPIVEGRF